MRIFRLSLMVSLFSLLMPVPTLAQDGSQQSRQNSPAEINSRDIDEIRRNVQVFSGVLRDSLDLDVRRSIFNRSAGAVTGRYLAGQGVVFEIISPLRDQSTMLGLGGLESSLRDLSRQIDGMDRQQRGPVRRPDPQAMREALALNLDRQGRGEVWDELSRQLAELRQTDVAAIEQSLRESLESARFLHNFGELSDEAFERVSEELSGLRAAFDERLATKGALEGELSQVDPQPEPDSSQLLRWRQWLEQLEDSLPELRDQAVAQAEALQTRAEQLREEREAEWQEARAVFEIRLFATLCDYGASLRFLADDEQLSVILIGLGDDDTDDRRTDRIHVLEKATLLQCQRGDLNASGLQASASSYDF